MRCNYMKIKIKFWVGSGYSVTGRAGPYPPPRERARTQAHAGAGAGAHRRRRRQASSVKNVPLFHSGLQKSYCIVGKVGVLCTYRSDTNPECCKNLESRMSYQKHFDHWTVVYSSGRKYFFKSEEAARHEAYMFGVSLIAPLFRD